MSNEQWINSVRPPGNVTVDNQKLIRRVFFFFFEKVKR